MKLSIALAILLVPSVAQASHRHHRVSHRSAAVTVSRLQSELSDLQSEIKAIRAQMGRPATPDVVTWAVPAMLHLPAVPAPVAAAARLASLPDLRLPSQQPAIPVPPVDPGPLPDGTIPSVTEEMDDAVALARAYLLRTATPGGTMARQGPAVALERLHPAMALRLAEAIRRAREAGLTGAGVYSAYRPPAYGVGAFRDKFRSLHSYGLATDMAGIGRPGSGAARLWASIVRAVGLYLPYGPGARHEWNHVQLVADHVAPARLRSTITARGPRDEAAMWAASGVAVPQPAPISSAHLLPENKF